jgi:hypothetical protein
MSGVFGTRLTRAFSLIFALISLLAVVGSTRAVAITEPAARDQVDADEARAKALAEACARSTCRSESREIRLRSTTGGEWGLTTQLFPYVDDGQIILYPGETIEVEFAADGKAMDKPRFARVVGSSAVVPPKEGVAVFSFELKQLDGKPDMMLTIKSTLGFPVKYDAHMFTFGKDGPQSAYTSSCPIIARGAAFETWPHEIGMIVLTDFRVVSQDRFVCE